MSFTLSKGIRGRIVGLPVIEGESGGILQRVWIAKSILRATRDTTDDSFYMLTFGR